MAPNEKDVVNKYSEALETANSYADIWQVVKDNSRNLP
jgi:hypothetical protein